MDCAEVRENLVARADGELPPAVRAGVDAHLAACAACAAEHDALLSTGDVLARLGGPPAPPEFAARVLAAVHAESETPSWCAHIRRELVAYGDGELPEAEARPVREHLAECAGCAAHAEELARTGAALAEWRLPAFTADLAARPALAAVARPTRRAGRLRRLASLAAAAALLAAVGFGAVRLSAPAAAEEPPIEVLRMMDMLEAFAEADPLLTQDPRTLEVAEHLDWLDSLSEEELALLEGAGG